MPAKKPDAEEAAVPETTEIVEAPTETPAPEVEAAPETDPNFARFVSVNPEPGGFPLGPYIPGRLETGSKILCWHVPLDDVDNMLKHFYVVSGRVRLQDVTKLGD
jgi:hypothetical protein